MLARIRDVLPMGLVQLEIGDLELTQRDTYPKPNIPKPIAVGVEAVIHTARKPRQPPALSLMSQILPHVDAMYTLYSDDMKTSIERQFIDELRKFVGGAPGKTLIGGRKSQEVMKYLSDTKQPPPNSLFYTLSFLLNARIHFDGKTHSFKDIEMLNGIELHKK